jgi:hypothetical protein
MVKLCTCQISDEIFGGFKVIIDLSYYDSKKEIIDYIKSLLIKILEKNNFISLREKALNYNFHIHDVDLNDFKNNIPENSPYDEHTIWICGHC